MREHISTLKIEICSLFSRYFFSSLSILWLFCVFYSDKSKDKRRKTIVFILVLVSFVINLNEASTFKYHLTERR